MIKTSKFIYNERAYRIEIAVDSDKNTVSDISYLSTKNENILNDCLQQIFSTMDPDESLDMILAYIGRTFHCDRVYVFEMTDTSASNTYEWCADGVVPQKNILQNMPLATLQWWLELFQEKKVIIRDIEEIRSDYPTSYAILKPQNIRTLTAGPLCVEERVTGFIGVDNPDRENLYLISSLFKVLGCFIVALLKRRDLLRRLHFMSFCDTLTGSFNRNALFEQYKVPWEGASLGVIFCDVTGLKHVNDTLGHGEGDRLIRQCYELIHNAVQVPSIFRTGGDEFVVVFENLKETTFLENVRRLQADIRESRHHIAMGYAWSDRSPLLLEELISRADDVMYRDKREYYALNRRIPGVERRESLREGSGKRTDSQFYQFVNSTYCDIEMFFQSIAMQNTTSYFYFGDMQKDMFYISDNMCDEFGFAGNVVPGLLQDWAGRVATERGREMFRRELDSMLREKRSSHDLRYQVRTADGRIIWVRCYGIMKWSEDKSVPLFFSGRVTHQDENFVVDPLTNFPREAIMFRSLDEARKKGFSLSAIGFSLNHFMEINSTRGRAYGDNLIRSIAAALEEKLSDRMSFYRLEGMRCVAIVDAGCHESMQELMDSIRDIVSERYGMFGVPIQQPCSFALVEYPRKNVMPEDFLEQVVALIRMAKHEVHQNYVEYSAGNIKKSRQLSNMALALSPTLCTE